MGDTSVLVIRRDDRFSQILRGAGFKVRNLELIETRPSGDLGDLNRKLERLRDYDGLFFTSPMAAEVFVERLNGRYQLTGKVYVLGERARKVFDGKGLNAVFRPDANTAEEFVASFDSSEFEGKKFLFVRGNKSLRTIPELLREIATVDDVTVYETVKLPVNGQQIELLRDEMERGKIDWVCFFSTSGVEEFTRIFEASDLEGVKAATIGETTAKQVRKSNLNVNFISKRSNAEEFARGLIEHIKTLE